jgi:hypothetical protein
MEQDARFVEEVKKTFFLKTQNRKKKQLSYFLHTIAIELMDMDRFIAPLSPHLSSIVVLSTLSFITIYHSFVWHLSTFVRRPSTFVRPTPFVH